MKVKVDVQEEIGSREIKKGGQEQSQIHKKPTTNACILAVGGPQI